MNITHASASENIIKFATEGRLVQGKWHGERDGREIACILGSIHPSVGSPKDCNGDLMPMWMAELTPVLFDGIPSADVVKVGLRYGALVARWHALTATQWEGILTKFLIRTIDDAVEYARPVCSANTYWEQVETACKQVVDALSGRGDLEAAARAAAIAAADAAAIAAARAARAAARAARAARAAARAAAIAAARAARAAADAAYLKLFNFLLDTIEQTLEE